MVSAFLSVLAVFGSILGIEYFVGRAPDSVNSAATSTKPTSVELTDRDLAMIQQHLQRARAQSRIIREAKNRIAPSMQIDGSLDAIDNSMADIGGLIGVAAQPLAQ